MREATKLRRVARLRAGGTPPVDDERYWLEGEGGTPWVAIGDMSDGCPVATTNRQVSDLGIERSRLPVGAPGVLLFAMYASVGAVNELAVTASWNQALLGIEPRPGLSHSRFTRYWLEHLRPTLGALTRSNTQDNLNADQVGNLPFPVVGFEEQRAIADYLDAETARIDALITKKRRMIDLLEVELDGRTDELIWNGGYDLVPLKHLVRSDRPIMYGIVLPGPDVDDGVLLVKGGSVKPGNLSPARLARTSVEIETGYARSRLQVGDLVFAIRGGVGDVEIVPRSIDGANITQDVARISPGSVVDRQYLLHALRAPKTQCEVAQRVTGATIRGINIWELDRLPVPVPGRHEQESIAGRLSALARRHQQLRDKLTRQIELLSEHRQALITAAVTGEFQVPRVAA